MSGVPTARPGQVKIQYGKVANDLMMCWGDGTAKADANLLICAVTSPKHHPFDDTWEPSLLDELRDRGYDITTLRISIEKVRP